MPWLRRTAVAASAILVVLAATLANPDPPQAKANVACDIGTSPIGGITGAVGVGDPVGDACNAVTDPVLGISGHVLDPLKDAASSLSHGVFSQITTWATDGAVWLLSEVVELTQKTTSPDLLSKGFLRQYRQMASIAVVLAALMLLFAALESLGRGEAGMLWRVFLVNVPLAAIATSAAYVVVGLLIATCDGFCEVIAHSTASDTHAFFRGAVQALAEGGGVAGAATGTAVAGTGTVSGAAAGATGVPLFVGFIAAIIAAFAAFAVWIELLMRDAAIYVVALFMPMAIAASIWPRWTSALRRTSELLIVVVFSKFVIVAIIALAASLLAHTEGKVEQVLAAGALLLLACFAPFVLFKLVPFAEGAVSSAYSRQGAGRAVLRTASPGSSVSMMRRAAHANWGGGPQGGSKGGGAGSSGGGGKPRPGGPGDGAGGAGEAAGASGGGGVAALPLAAGLGAAKASKAASERLSGTAIGRQATEAGSHPAGTGSAASGAKQASGGEAEAPRPRSAGSAFGEDRGDGVKSAGGGAEPPEPTTASGGKAPAASAKPPRPVSDAGATSKGGASAKAKP